MQSKTVIWIQKYVSSWKGITSRQLKFGLEWFSVELTSTRSCSFDVYQNISQNHLYFPWTFTSHGPFLRIVWVRNPNNSTQNKSRSANLSVLISQSHLYFPWTFTDWFSISVHCSVFSWLQAKRTSHGPFLRIVWVRNPNNSTWKISRSANLSVLIYVTTFVCLTGS